MKSELREIIKTQAKIQKELIVLLARYDITDSDSALLMLQCIIDDISRNAVLKNRFNPDNEAEH